MPPSALLSSFSPWYHKLMPVPEDSDLSDFSDEEQPEVIRQPFKGLVLCATGVPKDVRKQMREVTERMGGVYSPDLHRGCTHLVVQGTSGQKFRHAIKHGEKWGLKVVTMRWFLVSLQLNARMDESPYRVIVTDLSLENCDTDTVNSTDDCTDQVLQLRPENCSPVVDAGLGNGPKLVPHIQEPTEDSSTHSDLNMALALVPRPPSLELVTINGESAIAEVKVEEVKLSEDLFKGFCFYIDPEVSAKLLEQLNASIAAAGGSICVQWYIGCRATHLVCEGATLRKYIGRATSVVTPLWVLRSVDRGSLLKSVQYSVDMGRHLASLLGEQDDGPGRPAARSSSEQANGGGEPSTPSTSSSSQTGAASPSPSPIAAIAAERRRRREQEVLEMKAEIRQRRLKRPGNCTAAQKSLSPLQLLESVCWRVTDSPATARIYCDTDWELSPGAHPHHELQPDIGWQSPGTPPGKGALVPHSAWGAQSPQSSDGGAMTSSYPGGGRLGVSPRGTEWGLNVRNGLRTGSSPDSSSESSVRGMKESERSEVVFRGPFLTLLFPVDRFGELGPQSRGFFSENGFTRQQLLERVHTFYQEGMTDEEVSLAMHTDSKHAERLRAMYVAQPMDDRQSVRPLMLRWEFLGSRRSFEGLQRTSRDASGQVYDVVLSA